MDKLERKFGRYAIKNLMYYVIILYGVGFVLNLINPTFYMQYLSLDARAILHGQVWRIFTFIIQPPSSSPIWMALALYVYYMIGSQLEQAMGAFRFNLYFFTGILLHAASAVIVYLMTGNVLLMSTWYLNMSLFLLFAAIYPNVRFLLFFVVPVEAKYLALLDGVYFLIAIVQAFRGTEGLPVGVAAGVSLFNFFLFFFGFRKMRPYSPREIYRKNVYKKKIRKEVQYEDGARHKCCVCGRTDITNPELEFRYCSKCAGDREYCQDHLFTHVHVKE